MPDYGDEIGSAMLRQAGNGLLRLLERKRAQRASVHYSPQDGPNAADGASRAVQSDEWSRFRDEGQAFTVGGDGNAVLRFANSARTDAPLDPDGTVPIGRSEDGPEQFARSVSDELKRRRIPHDLRESANGSWEIEVAKPWVGETSSVVVGLAGTHDIRLAENFDSFSRQACYLITLQDENCACVLCEELARNGIDCKASITKEGDWKVLVTEKDETLLRESFERAQARVKAGEVSVLSSGRTAREKVQGHSEARSPKKPQKAAGRRSGARTPAEERAQIKKAGIAARKRNATLKQGNPRR